MATATLELINPYSKYGLKRRPTYDEIMGLIKENETITGNLPDRIATFYKASPEGSFFDGSDALEILKEQQNRIMEREMRDILMRRNARLNGRTYNAERILASQSNTALTEVQPDRETLSAEVQADLQRREQQLRNREQQTGEAFGQALSEQSRMPTLQGFIGESLSPIFRLIPSSTGQPSVPQLPIPQRQAEQIDLTRGDDMRAEEEEFFPEEMTTAREEPPKKSPKLMKNISYSTNISRWSEQELAFQLYLRGVDVQSPEISLENMRKKGKGRGLTNWQHYQNLAQTMIINGEWDRRIEEPLLQSRITEFKNRNKSRGSRD